MRFSTYLIESTNENLFTDIKKKCKPYLSLLKGKEPLYRGIHDPSDALVTDGGLGYGIKKVHKDRNPKGTPLKDFKLLNKWLEGNEHVRRDQSISVTADINSAQYFGSNSWIFPIGKFRYSWVKSHDMNHNNKKTGYYVDSNAFGRWDDDDKVATIGDFLKAYYSGTLDSRTKEADLANFITTNKGFDEAYRKEYEIWIDCKEYYYILVKSKEGHIYTWKELSNMI